MEGAVFHETGKPENSSFNVALIDFSTRTIETTKYEWVGAIYMLYLAWCIATSGPLDERNSDSRTAEPMSVLGAAAFQWVNPKAWIMAVGAFSAYVPASSEFVTIAGVAVLFAVINLPSVGVWALFGSGLRHVLQVKRNLLAFNYCMAGLLVASLYPLLHAS